MEYQRCVIKEAIFNTEVKNSINYFGEWAYKIADMPRVPGLRFNPDKPCDIISNIDGKFVAIEGKQFKKWQSLRLSHFQDSQIENFNQLLSQGKENCYVFLNIRISSDKDAGIKRENRCIIFKWKELKELIKERGIYAKELKELTYIEGKNKMFDLSEFLLGIK
jgi:hypothetical protein